jgi:hypothetical protein
MDNQATNISTHVVNQTNKPEDLRTKSTCLAYTYVQTRSFVQMELLD